MTKKCLICNKEFYIVPSHKYRSKFCSRLCYYKSIKGKKLSKKTKYKISIAHKGLQGMLAEKNPFWRGGKHKSPEGYIFIYTPNHPFRDFNKYIAEHRLIIEKYINRYLTSKEVVHHIGQKDDNRVHMLICFIHQNAHQRFHKGYPIKHNEIIFDGRNLHA